MSRKSRFSSIPAILFQDRPRLPPPSPPQWLMAAFSVSQVSDLHFVTLRLLPWLASISAGGKPWLTGLLCQAVALAPSSWLLSFNSLSNSFPGEEPCSFLEGSFWISVSAALWCVPLLLKRTIRIQRRIMTTERRAKTVNRRLPIHLWPKNGHGPASAALCSRNTVFYWCRTSSC